MNKILLNEKLFPQTFFFFRQNRINIYIYKKYYISKREKFNPWYAKESNKPYISASTGEINDPATNFLRFPFVFRRRRVESSKNNNKKKKRKKEKKELAEGHFTRWKSRHTVRTRFSAVNIHAKAFLEEGMDKTGQPWGEIGEILRAPLHPSRGILFDEGVEILERATFGARAWLWKPIRGRDQRDVMMQRCPRFFKVCASVISLTVSLIRIVSSGFRGGNTFKL